MALDRDIYNYAGNLKWNVGANHTLSVSAFGDPSKGKLGAQRADAVAVGKPFERFSEIDYGGHNVIGRWNGSVLSNLFVEASVGYHRDLFKEDPQSNLPNGTDRRPPSPLPPIQYGGVGFFEAGNFHPDFILWLIVGGKQFIAFIDPKGIRNLGYNDPKIQFFQTIKDIERRLAEPSVTLSSFIISNTPSHVMRLLWAVEKTAMDARNILFQEEDKTTYVRDMMHRIAASARAN